MPVEAGAAHSMWVEAAEAEVEARMPEAAAHKPAEQPFQSGNHKAREHRAEALTGAMAVNRGQQTAVESAPSRIQVEPEAGASSIY